jgi:hypothetical protein
VKENKINKFSLFFTFLGILFVAQGKVGSGLFPRKFIISRVG